MPESPSPEQLLLIGEIVGPHGLRGQVKLYAVTNRVDHLQAKIRTVYVGPKHTAYQLRGIIEHKPGLLLLALEGVSTREQAEALRGSEVSIDERDAAPLAADEYFIHQLYGLRVVTTSGEEIGTVREVIETGANEVLVVTREGQADALIPMIHDVVRELDVASSTIVIEPIAGLLSDDAA
jgi:16S rRNA processing protein RimM